MPKTKDYYEVLGVPRTASQKEITAAFRKHVDPATLIFVKAGDFKKAGVLQ